MSDSVEAKRDSVAWQPFTPRGVVAFARAPLRRLLLMQFIFALLAAVAVVWFLRTAWFPTVRQAVENVPGQGQVRAGKLDWAGDSPVWLAEGHFLAFDVDTNHSGLLRSPAQVQIEFGRDDIFFYSLAGYREWPYPAEWNFGFSREALKPWWGAWQAPIQWLAFVGTLFWCLANWWVLSTVYCLPVWLAGFFSNRNLSLGGSWKMAGAALMPGAVVMILAILLYGFAALDMVQFAAVVAAHFVVGWVYLIWSVSVCPKVSVSEIPKGNPFSTEVEEKRSGEKKPENPFAARAGEDESKEEV